MTLPSVTFDEYWDLFVRAHAEPSVRRVHFVATSAGLGVAAVGVLTRRVTLLLVATAVAFVPPWAARKAGGPRTTLPFHPAYAALASARMWRMTLVGTMSAEVVRVLRTDVEDAPDSDDGPLPRPNMVTDHTLH